MPILEKFPIISQFLSRFRTALRVGIRSSTPVPPVLQVGLLRNVLKEEVEKALADTEPLIQRLKNVDRVMSPLNVSLEKFIPGTKQMLGITVSVLLPNGKVEVYHIGFPFGKPFDKTEFIRRLTSAIQQRHSDTNGKEGYRDMDLSANVRKMILTQKEYVVEYHAR
jgi:hypothetical protein